MQEEKKSTYKGSTEARKEANKRYMEKFCEVKVRMTSDKRDIVKAHAEKMGESSTAFINRTIDETIEKDDNK